MRIRFGTTNTKNDCIVPSLFGYRKSPHSADAATVQHYGGMGAERMTHHSQGIVPGTMTETSQEFALDIFSDWNLLPWCFRPLTKQTR